MGLCISGIQACSADVTSLMGSFTYLASSISAMTLDCPAGVEPVGMADPRMLDGMETPGSFYLLPPSSTRRGSIIMIMYCQGSIIINHCKEPYLTSQPVLDEGFEQCSQCDLYFFAPTTATTIATSTRTWGGASTRTKARNKNKNLDKSQEQQQQHDNSNNSNVAATADVDIDVDVDVDVDGLFVCLFVCLVVCLLACFLACLPVRFFVCFFVCLFVASLFVYFVCLCCIRVIFVTYLVLYITYPSHFLVIVVAISPWKPDYKQL